MVIELLTSENEVASNNMAMLIVNHLIKAILIINRC